MLWDEPGDKLHELNLGPAFYKTSLLRYRNDLTSFAAHVDQLRSQEDALQTNAAACVV